MIKKTKTASDKTAKIKAPAGTKAKAGMTKTLSSKKPSKAADQKKTVIPAKAITKGKKAAIKVTVVKKVSAVQKKKPVRAKAKPAVVSKTTIRAKTTKIEAPLTKAKKAGPQKTQETPIKKVVIPEKKALPAAKKKTIKKKETVLSPLKSSARITSAPAKKPAAAATVSAKKTVKKSSVSKSAESALKKPAPKAKKPAPEISAKKAKASAPKAKAQVKKIEKPQLTKPLAATKKPAAKKTPAVPVKAPLKPAAKTKAPGRTPTAVIKPVAATKNMAPAAKKKPPVAAIKSAADREQKSPPLPSGPAVLRPAAEKVVGPSLIKIKKAAVPVSGTARMGRIAAPKLPSSERPQEELLSIAEIEAREIPASKLRLKIYLPGEEGLEAIPAAPAAGEEALPEEYGPNSFFLIVVDPNVVFLDWEIASGAVPGDTLPLSARIYDVTGLEFDGSNAHGFVEIALDSLSGRGYCEIMMHGRDILAEIGFVDASGKFIALIRTARVSVPPLLYYDELGIVQKLRESGIPVGY